MKISVMIYERGNSINGPVVNQKRLLHALKSRGYKIQVLCLYHESSPLCDDLQNSGVTAHKYPAGKYTHETVPWIIKSLQEFEPDLFVSDWIAPGAIAGRWLRQAGIPTVGGLRSDDSYFWSLMDRFAMKNAGIWALSGVFCVNRELEVRLQDRLCRRTRTCFIPSGVPFPSVIPPKQHPVKMVYLGRIEVRQKQILETTRAMCNAVLNVRNATGMLVGNGPDEESVKQIIKDKGCTAKIQLKSRVEPEKIPSLLKEFNVIVLLSDYEGTPGALMDGMANGLVPICINSGGGVSELVSDGQSGLFVNDHGRDFVNAIRRLNDDEPLIQKLSKNARKRIREDYTLEHTVKRWESFFETLLLNSGPRLPIKLPRKIRLPKQHPDMLGFDYRPPSKRQILTNKCRITLGAFKNMLLGRN
jgi:colanic acid/amylovoran biosynthesis glycosyltransferase